MRFAVIGLIMSVVAMACSSNADSRTTDPPASLPSATHFTAVVSGAVEGTVSGPGVIGSIPASEVTGVPGYWFISDDTGVRDIGVVFSIPGGTEPGSYDLVSVHPVDRGTVFEVRVDKSSDDLTTSFETDSTGTITLDHFSVMNEAGERRVAGSFEFATANRDGEQVTATGTFDFTG